MSHWLGNLNANLLPSASRVSGCAAQASDCILRIGPKETGLVGPKRILIGLWSQFFVFFGLPMNFVLFFARLRKSDGGEQGRESYSMLRRVVNKVSTDAGLRKDLVQE